MLLVIGVLIDELLYNIYIHVDLNFHRTTIKQLRGGLLQNQKLTFQTLLLHVLSVRHWVFLIIIFNKVLMN